MEDLLRSVDFGLVVLDHISGRRLHGIKCIAKDAEPVVKKIVTKNTTELAFKRIVLAKN